MEFQTITINGNRCLVERLSSSDLGYSAKKNWKVFLHYNIANDVPVVTDVYCCDDVNNAIWPTPNSITSNYSNKYETFTQDLQSFSNVNCNADIIRIWIPSSLKMSTFLFHSSSLINSVKYHWSVTDISKCERDVGKMRKYGHDWYVEYVDIEVPNIASFFSSDSYINFPSRVKLDYKTVHNKTFKFVDTNNNEVTPSMKEVHLNDQEFQLLSNDVKSACESEGSGKWLLTYWNLEGDIKQLIRTRCLLRKWKISKYTDGSNQVEFVGDEDNPDRSPISCLLFPWSTIRNFSYMLDSDSNVGTCTYTLDNTINLYNKIEFVKGKVCVVGKFTYPGHSTLQQYYENTYNVKLSDYKKKSEEIADLVDEIEVLEGRPEMCGYKMIIAMDKNMQQVIHKEEAYDNAIDDFSFPIIDLFSDWNEVPTNVYVQVKFIDRNIGLSIASVPHLMTKDEIKYTITDTREGRVTELPSLQEYSDDNPYIPIEYKKDIEIEMSENRPFFIDNIRCYVTRENTDYKSNTKAQYKPRIVYKPIFYRIEDAQTVKIRNKMVQNVGVNLSKYMTRVDTFYMRINGVDFQEIARNGIYVIFEVNAISNVITDTYDIIDDEGNYITTGSITIM